MRHHRASLRPDSDYWLETSQIQCRVFYHPSSQRAIKKIQGAMQSWWFSSQVTRKFHGLSQGSPTFLAPGTGFVEDSFSTDGVGGGSGGNVSYGERWGAADEASLTLLLLTSCCAARFLIGHRLVPSAAWGLGTPGLSNYMSFSYYYTPKLSLLIWRLHTQ